MTIPISNGIHLDTRYDPDSHPWTQAELETAYYHITATTDAESLICEPMTLDSLDSEFHGGMILDAVITTYARLPRTIGAMARSLNKKLTSGLEVTSTEMGKVKKSGIFASVAAIVHISDGQSVSVIFHAPDDDPKKIDQGDRLIAFQFLMNRSDITGHVAPTRSGTGFAIDQTLDQVVTRIAQLIVKNSDTFQKKQKIIADQKAKLVMVTEELEQTHTAIQETIQAIADADAVISSGENDEHSLNLRLENITAENEKLESQIARLERNKKQDVNPVITTSEAEPEVIARYPDKKETDLEYVVVKMPEPVNGNYYATQLVRIGEPFRFASDTFTTEARAKDDAYRSANYLPKPKLYQGKRSNGLSESSAKAWISANRKKYEGHTFKLERAFGTAKFGEEDKFQVVIEPPGYGELSETDPGTSGAADEPQKSDDPNTKAPGDTMLDRIEALRTLPIEEYEEAMDALVEELEASGEIEQYEAQLEDVDRSRNAEFVKWAKDKLEGLS